ncbi:histone deacetylase 8-like [Physella acuta]|uniref:histone deacetylase 8-like n=1 Tax=Physella acuta TaxID=109671 RepID=UPI0027DAFFF0|nr:histone deacetylase 8-like [Physella acuta]
MPFSSDTQCIVDDVDVKDYSAERSPIAKLFTGNHGNLISTEASKYNLSVATDECSTQPHCDTDTLCTNSVATDECSTQPHCDTDTLCTNSVATDECSTQPHCDTDTLCTNSVATDECSTQPHCDTDTLCTNSVATDECSTQPHYDTDTLCTNSVATDECSTQPHCDTETLCTKRKVSSGDPFDLCDDEEEPKKKYRPIQRKCNTLRQDVDSIGSLVKDLDSDTYTVKSEGGDTDTVKSNYGETDTVKSEDGDTDTVKSEGGDTDTVKSEGGDTDKVPVFEDAPTETLKVANTGPAKDIGKVLRVIYLHSDELLDKTNQLIRIEGRAELVHSLIRIYGLLNYLQVFPPRTATESEILGFHCPEYISCLRGDSLSDTESGETEEFGLSYDCPHQNGVFETARLICGASIVAAEKILDGSANVAINWYGGWHHAKRDSASGFCYMNDIVLCVLKLREKFERILYVDIDLHHGDGVEEAFFTTSKVMTVSFHKLAPGFFPGSGDVDSVGSGRGKFYSINVPLMDGIKDSEFFTMVYKVMNQVREKFTPDVLVLQCGADGLAEDPMASFNLTHTGMARCVSYMLSWRLPTVLLGGGGYNFPATAKCWTVLTSVAVGKKLPVDIPEHQHLLAYGPSYDLSTCVGNRRDCNTKPYLANLLAKISKHLSNIPAAHTS